MPSEAQGIISTGKCTQAKPHGLVAHECIPPTRGGYCVWF